MLTDKYFHINALLAEKIKTNGSPSKSKQCHGYMSKKKPIKINSVKAPQGQMFSVNQKYWVGTTKLLCFHLNETNIHIWKTPCNSKLCSVGRSFKSQNGNIACNIKNMLINLLCRALTVQKKKNFQWHVWTFHLSYLVILLEFKCIFYLIEYKPVMLLIIM